MVLTLTMSKTLFSTHVFTKKDFVFIVDLAVLTASFIKTFKEIDTFSILWILPNQHYFSILRRHYLAKKPGYPQFFCWISIPLTTTYFSPTVIIWKKILPISGHRPWIDLHNLVYHAKAKEEHKPSKCRIGWRQRTSRTNRLQRHVHWSSLPHAGRTSPPVNQ